MGMKAALLILAAASAAHAETSVRAAIDGKGHVVKLATTWGEHPRLDLDGTLVYAGEALGTVVTGHGVVVVAYATGTDKPFAVRVSEGGVLHDPLTFARTSKRKEAPFAIAAAATPDGFAIFYQQVETADPTAAHTYLLQLTAGGEVAAAPTEIAVPWALADVIWDGDGYHLALIYAGGGDGMRLSMVHLTRDGRPQGHPDWATAPGIIADVHLTTVGDRVLAFYRNGDRLIETDVTKVGIWGRVTDVAKDRGALAETTVFAVDAKGEPQRLR
jgi:hypothetical protein